MKIHRISRALGALIVLTVLATYGTAATASASVSLSGAVPTRYEHKLRWNPHERLLSGSGGVDVTNIGPSTINEIWLRLRPNSEDGLESLRWASNARIGRSIAGGSMVPLELKRPLAPGQSRHFSYGLRLRVPRANTSLGRSAGVDLFGDALPVVAVSGPRGIRFGPEPAYGEGSMNPVAQWFLELEVPRGLGLVAPNGAMELKRSKRRTTFFSSLEARDFAFAIGRFRTITQTVSGVHISVSGAAESRNQLRPALRRTVNAFRTLRRWYGHYKLAALQVVIGDLPFGGSEYPGLVFSTPDNATIAHEVAHQWFYGLVGNDQYNDPFLDESLTAFAEQRLHKSYRCNLASPIDGRAHGLGTDMSYWEEHPAAYEHTIYRGGACALTVLQRDLGADVFDRAIRAYVRANANKIAGVDDFLAAIKSAAPWYDLARWQRLVGL